MKFVFAAAVAIAGLPPLSVSAHVVVAPAMAAPGATETLNFIVGHGCAGQPTTALRVELPATVTSVQPQPKVGWTPTVDVLADGGRAVTWRGGAPLTKADGFAVRVRLPGQGGPVAFPAVQSCGETTVRWTSRFRRTARSRSAPRRQSPWPPQPSRLRLPPRPATSACPPASSAWPMAASRTRQASRSTPSTSTPWWECRTARRTARRCGRRCWRPRGPSRSGPGP